MKPLFLFAILAVPVVARAGGEGRGTWRYIEPTPGMQRYFEGHQANAAERRRQEAGQRAQERERRRISAVAAGFLRAAVGDEGRRAIKENCEPRGVQRRLDRYELRVDLLPEGVKISCPPGGRLAGWSMESRAEAFVRGYTYLHEGTAGSPLVIENSAVPREFANLSLDQKAAALNRAGISLQTLRAEAFALGQELYRETQREEEARERARQLQVLQERVQRYQPRF